MIRLVLIALVLLGGFYAHGRLAFSEPRVMGWMTQHAARSMQGDSIACDDYADDLKVCLLYTSPSPRDLSTSRMPSSA